MKRDGYVHESEQKTLRLRKKAFVGGAVPFKNEDVDDEVKGEKQPSA